MSESRRGFLAQCLGGAASLAAGVGAPVNFTAITRVLLCGAVPVKFTRPLKDLGISFMHCAHCGRWNQILIFKPEECRVGNWQLGGKEGLNTAQEPCRQCRLHGAEHVDFHREESLHKLLITPTTSHLLLEPDPRPKAAEPDEIYRDFIRRINSDDHLSWLAQEVEQRPVAQLLPKLGPLDVFLPRQAPLFGLHG